LGNKGGYSEDATPDSSDVYGTTKMLGEIRNSKHLTLRTSIIGHELASSISLVDWFLAQEIPVLGFRKAIFSGLPSVYIAELLTNNILENHKIAGLRNLAVEPINKFLLLSKIANFYNFNLPITPDDNLEIDRSLDGSSLFKDIGLICPSWDDLIAKMHTDFYNSNLYGTNNE
jgi:dTDP-4-dehydrorhamnose reductase